jgi:signal transduction histidine kinase
VTRLWRVCRARPDPFIAAALTAFAILSLMAEGQLGELPGSLCVLGFCALIAVRRWNPLAIALVAGAIFTVPRLTEQTAVTNNGSYIPLWAAIFLFAYTLGSECPIVPSLIGLAAIVISVNLSSGPFNPVPEMVAIGPWLAGVLMASRRVAADQLALRARELEAEREIFAVQSVRYERARIARELHDIVAHSVSMMVVQANAGERLATTDPQRAAEAFESIGEAARQAEDEIDRLVELLNDSAPASPSAGIRIVEELVQRAHASGLDISCQLSGDIDDLTDGRADAAYRLVQEAITNAMKHAPGAAMEISVLGTSDGLEITVLNGRPLAATSGLERAGGGNGLAGMRERMVQCGGTFSAGAMPDGGWRVRALLPRTTNGWHADVPGSLSRTEGT